MKRKTWAALFSGDRHFVSLRAISSLAALSFALIYSMQLGVERRGLLTLIMTSNLVFSILTISGLSLHLRNFVRTNQLDEKLVSYIILVFFSSVLAPIMNYSLLVFFKYVKEISIPNNLLLVSAVYCFLSTLTFGVHDTLLLLNQLRLASAIDLSIVVLQLVSYLLLVFAGETSYIISVLIAMSISYVVATFSILVLVLVNHTPTFAVSMKSIKTIIRGSSTPVLNTLANQLIDRLDKLFLGLLGSVGDLGRYSTTQSIVSLIRFVPDSVGKLIILRNRNLLAVKSKMNFLALSLLCPFFAFAIDIFVKLVLGAQWSLSFSFILALVFVELLRGLQHLSSMENMLSIGYSPLRQVSTNQIKYLILIQPILIHFFNIWGAVLSSLFIYGYGFMKLRIRFYD
jgi:hypothetical protein